MKQFLFLLFWQIILWHTPIITHADLQEFLIESEVMDIKEIGQLFLREADFKENLGTIVNRIILLERSPKLKFRYLFPSRDIILQLMESNKKYCLHVRNCRDLYDENDYRYNIYNDIMKETEYLFSFWEALEDSSCDFYYIYVRRIGLRKVKEILSKQGLDFYQGHTLPHVPYWRFTPLNGDSYEKN